jgi:peptidoglycan/xylan/chitin deacetylase (PgdA/CDA1 family)
LFSYVVIDARADCANPNAIGTSRVITLNTRTSDLKLALQDKELVLTFDDGPLPPSTDTILNALAAECVKATFFIVGEMANDSPDQVLRAARLGHTIGTHTQTHPHLTTLPLHQATKEIEDGISSTAKALKSEKTLAPFFRPPYLEVSPELQAYLASRGLLVWNFGWLFDDWTDISAGALITNVLRRVEEERKGVIILHDIWPVTAQALPQLLEGLKQRGFRIVHVAWDGPPHGRTYRASSSQPK